MEIRPMEAAVIYSVRRMDGRTDRRIDRHTYVSIYIHRQTDRRIDMVKVIGAFGYCGNAPKIS
jgi:hypothetical protein